MKLNSKSINYNVQTVDELVSLDGLEGDTVVVTDENRGGVFVYREDNVGTNNEGTIFDGWTRQYDGAVNVKWFGVDKNIIANLKFSGTSNDTYISTGYYEEGDGGSGLYVWDSFKSKSMHNGVSIIDPTHTADITSSDYLIAENTSDGVWVCQQGYYIRQFNVYVGDVGDFQTLNEAITHLSTIKPNAIYNPDEEGIRSDTAIKIKLRAGFIMEEQLLLSNIDLGYIWIETLAVDKIVSVVRSSMTRPFTSRGLLESYPLFGIANGVFPVLNDIQFELDSTGDANGKNGIIIRDNGHFYCNYGVAIRNAWWGIYLSYNSFASIMDLDVSGFLEHGIHVRHHSRLTGRNIVKANNGTGRALNAESNSTIEITGAFQSTEQTNSEILIRSYGSSQITISGNTDLFTDAERTIKGKETYVVYAEESSKIAIYNHLIKTTTPASVYALVVSTTNAYVDLTTSNVSLAGAVQRVLWANNGGTIKAQGLSHSGSTVTALLLSKGGTIDVTDGNFSLSNIGATIDNSTLMAYNCNFSGQLDYGIFSTTAGNINCEYSNISGCANYALYAKRGTIIQATNSDLHSSVAVINCFESSQIYANNANTTRTSGTAIYISGGSIVSNVGGSGTSSITANTITANGILFR